MKVTELMPLGVEAEIMEAFASPPSEAAGRAEPDWSIMEGTGKAGRLCRQQAQGHREEAAAAPGTCLRGRRAGAGGRGRMRSGKASLPGVGSGQRRCRQRTASSRVLLAPGTAQGQSPEAAAWQRRWGAGRDGCSSTSPESPRLPQGPVPRPLHRSPAAPRRERAPLSPRLCTMAAPEKLSFPSLRREAAGRCSPACRAPFLEGNTTTRAPEIAGAREQGRPPTP